MSVHEPYHVRLPRHERSIFHDGDPYALTQLKDPQGYFLTYLDISIGVQPIEETDPTA